MKVIMGYGLDCGSGEFRIELETTLKPGMERNVARLFKIKLQSQARTYRLLNDGHKQDERHLRMPRDTYPI